MELITLLATMFLPIVVEVIRYKVTKNLIMKALNNGK